MSDRARWLEIQALLEALWQLPEEAREDHLQRHCPDDSLRREVQALMAADLQAQGYFDRLAAEAGVPSAAVPEPGDMSGRRVGAYRLVEVLGRGGMGVVYLAERADGEFAQQVAIKLLPMGAAGAEGLRRFQAERQILATLAHPGIARLLHGGVSDDGTPYFVMERVQGERIDLWCDQRRLGVDGRLRLLCRVVEAVAFAHRHLVVHRDLKPPNVLVTAEGEVKLLDFGVAKLLSDAAGDLTGSRVPAPLTPLWAAPEQLDGSPVTTATDTYALGALGHLLLTGMNPHEERAAAAPADVLPRLPSRRFAALPAAQQTTLAAQREAAPRDLVRRLSGDLDAVLLRALDPQPQRRYGTADEMLADLQRYLERKPVSARVPSLRYRAARFVVRHRTGVAAAAAVVMLLVSLVIVSIQSAITSREQERRVASERDRAEEQRAEAQAVREFMENVLLTAQPLVGLGRDATILEGLDHIAEQYHDSAISPSARVDAQVRLAIGNVYTRLGRYDESEQLVRSAHDALVAALGPAHPEVSRALFELGEIALGRGEFAAAADRMAQAVAIRDAALDAADPGTGNMLHRLGWALANAGEIERARALLERSVRILRGADEPAAVADPLSVLGNVLRLTGAPGAEAMMREALQIRERYLPPDHTKLAESYNNLAVLLDDQGRREEAAELYRRAIAIQQAVFGPDSEFVAASLGNLGVLLTNLDRHVEAQDALERALAIDRAALGDDHRYVATDRQNLARSLCAAPAQAAAGREQVERALATLHAQLDADHWHLATARSILGVCLWRLGELDRAEVELRASLARLRREFGDDQINVAMARERLEAFHRETGRRAAPLP